MPPPHRPRRRFSQNFLRDRQVIERIVAAIDPRPDDRVLEIGPGQGALTWPLAARLERLHAIEIDRDLAAALRADPRSTALALIEGDALAFALPAGPPWRVVGNLPYHISTPLLFHLHAQRARLVDLHLMLQAEVVERMAAGPGGKDYGRLSVMLQASWQVEALFTVPAEAFHPRPEVRSAVVRLRPRDDAIDPTEEPALERIVRAAFGQRRKTLGNALRGVLGAEALHALGVDPGARAEQLSVADYRRLAAVLGTTTEPARPGPSA